MTEPNEVDMTGIDPLPSGRFRARVQQGKEVVSKTFDTAEEAVRFRAAVLREIADGQALFTKGDSIHSIGPRFLASRAGNRDVKTDVSRWHKHIARSAYARLPLGAVTKADGLAWLEDLRVTKTAYDPKRHGVRIVKPLAWSSRRHCLNLARRAFEWAIVKGLLVTNPFLDLAVEREDGDEDEGYQDGWYLDAKDQERFFGLWDSIDWTPSKFTKDDLATGFAERRRAEKHIAGFAMSGPRQGEQWCLHLSDVHIDGPEPHYVVRFGSWDPIKKRYRSPKGRKGEKKTRNVPLFGIALESARAWLAILPTYAPSNPLGLMFPTDTGARRDKKPPRSWDPVAETFGVVPRIGRSIWWHLLRHTCASAMVSGAWGHRWALEYVRDVLGHTSIRTTEIYAHLAPSAVQETATRAQAAWAGRHAAVTLQSPGTAKAAENKLYAHVDSNHRPTAPEASGIAENSRVVAGRDGAVTAIVGALRAIEQGEPTALRTAVDALTTALDALLAGAESQDASAFRGSR